MEEVIRRNKLNFTTEPSSSSPQSSPSWFAFSVKDLSGGGGGGNNGGNNSSLHRVNRLPTGTYPSFPPSFLPSFLPPILPHLPSVSTLLYYIISYELTLLFMQLYVCALSWKYHNRMYIKHTLTPQYLDPPHVSPLNILYVLGYELILSRDALQHLPYKSIAGAVNTYCSSTATFLLVGSYLDHNDHNKVMTLMCVMY